LSEELWVIRAGERAKYADEFLRRGYVAIGFEEFAPDNLALTDPEAVRARASTPAERVYAGQLIVFAYKINIGDFVIVPRLPAHRDYLVARVTGSYSYVEGAGESGRHHRSVEWLGSFRRDFLSQAAINTMGAITTIFRPLAVEAELRDLFSALTPIDGHVTVPTRRPDGGRSDTDHGRDRDTLPLGIAPPVRPFAQAQLDIELDSQGRAGITCNFPALIMEQTPRHLDPRGDWAGVPGIYVLTGTELQRSVSRTGSERTLTMTLIVRPWAYVGLSEDFLGRIGSHRQSKPEWRRALLVRSGGQLFGSDDIKYLERRVHGVLEETGQVSLDQATPRGNVSAHPRSPTMLDACAETIVAVLRLTGTLI
jgi:hypothetical protein